VCSPVGDVSKHQPPYDSNPAVSLDVFEMLWHRGFFSADDGSGSRALARVGKFCAGLRREKDPENPAPFPVYRRGRRILRRSTSCSTRQLKRFARDGGAGNRASERPRAEAGSPTPVLFKLLFEKNKEAFALHLFERCYPTASAGVHCVLFVNEELRRLLGRKSSAATRKHTLIGVTRAFFAEGELTKAIEPTLLVARILGTARPVRAPSTAFGEWRGKAVDGRSAVGTIGLEHV